MSTKKTTAKKKPRKKRAPIYGTRGAPKGNQFWKNATRHGRKKLFETPEILWEAASEYFQWCDEHPWDKAIAVKAGDHFGEIVNEPTPRPYTISGLCVYLDIDEETFHNYGNGPNYKEFFGIVHKIKKIMYTQKFEGAAVGAFNSSIIARDLGLAEKSSVEVGMAENTQEFLKKVTNKTKEIWRK